MKTVLVGGQYGDEGKGKVTSYLAQEDNPDIVVRGGVGPNAGHEVHDNGKVYKLRLLPCGFLHKRSRLLIGAGVLVNSAVFLKEVNETGTQGRVGIDFRSVLITEEHRRLDAGENSKKIGTTGTGCGPAMADRVSRIAKQASSAPELKDYMCDVEKEVNEAKNVLVEGSQGFMLSLFYGSYPFVTSKDTTASSVAADVGLGPKSVDKVVMVIKAYTTRVGEGPFSGEITEEEAVRAGMSERGTVTGRVRRISKDLHFDDLRRAARINSATDIALTKLDVRFKGNTGARHLDELTPDARDFVKHVGEEIGVPVTLIGTGPDAKDIIDIRRV